MRLFKGKFFLFLLLIFIAQSAYPEHLIYEIEWGLIPVANAQLEWNAGDNKLILSAEISSSGPLALFRNFESNVNLSYNEDKNIIYSQVGIDRGKPENKIIEYSDTHIPVVHDFMDDQTNNHLETDQATDGGSVNPMIALMKTIQNLQKDQKCNQTYKVYDGKRRYELRTRAIENEVSDQNYRDLVVHKCRFVMINLSEMKKKNRINQKQKNSWPYDAKNENKYIDVWFSEDYEYLPVYFKFKAPIGYLEGKVRNTFNFKF